MKGKGLVCHKLGSLADLAVQEIEVGAPAEGEVVVNVAAAAVNFPDLLIVKGLYQARPELPFVVGSEMAGIVAQVGAGVTHLQVGDRVAGYGRVGAFGSIMTLLAKNVLPIPEAVSLEQAAAYTIAYGTSYHALVDRARIKEGERVLVLGAAGGVGLAAVEIANMMGAEVTACASTAEKLALATEYGATHTINYQEQNLSDRIKEIHGRRGVDVIYDPVGGDFSEQVFRRLGFGGRHLVVGFAAGAIPKLPFNLPLLKSASLMGVFWGAFCEQFPEQARNNHVHILKLIGEGKLNPKISKVFPLEKGIEAMQWVADRKVLGKILIRS